MSRAGSGGVHRRRFLGDAARGSALVAAGALVSRVARADAPAKLVVFVPTAIQSHALQALLQEAVPGASVVAFARFRDFETGVEAGPDAAIALEPTLSAKALPLTLTGRSGSSTTERYALVAVGASAEPVKVKSVGAVDILGRQGMKELVGRLLGASPRVERVTKVEDLLPLLELSSVESVLLPERLVASLRDRSKLDLQTTTLPVEVGLPCLAVMTPAGAPLVDRVRNANERVNRELGVTRWA